jgi:hypothetical protein
MGLTGSTGIEHAVQDRQIAIPSQTVDEPPAPQATSEDQAVEHEESIQTSHDSPQLFDTRS